MQISISPRRRLAVKLGLLLVAAGASAGAWAQSAQTAQVPALPQAPIRLIVPFTPGTGIDLIARTLGPRLSERLGRPVVVDNRAGASGNIGTEAVVRAAPNGSTLLVTVNTLVMNASLYPQLTFDPVKDLTPVTLTSWGQLLLVANPKTGFKSASDLMAAARQKPGRINYGSPGVGTPHHLAMELFKSTAGVFVTHIPYRGTGPALTDLLGGQIETMFLPIHVALPHVKSGRLVALGIGSDKRHALLPEVPTLAEARAGKVHVDMWYGIFAPPGTSPDLVALYNREIREILLSDEVKKAFQTQGMDPSGSTPGEFKSLVELDAKRWAGLIQAQGITAN
ncbi:MULTISPECIES: tripartite tricarboxylate transporter substrate binding protein [unclassified Polaromonas]|jgi:tripartite-type tricarboxylate transporter receptor subunit TctC|uniref:tripartite tricarboxylate transporter substrate binding protein n=1 Tax=unclassified Polaromonas TaxID=2638319 RepID=UPI000BDCC7CF|nr:MULTISPECIES: tripartite tricarboxylate transporter substrate binding protein [unclassified Polaromonas]OYY35056.1 MAG: Twin-arginine translocation pathway signal [Polaromonas sp. 35-63-35]OYZ20196.1 MAG: Twin-arginine translocation pathway signal [Polaromonas sp. 16-63-31]OYZ77951.1 MAG: Twin-arginine translocation pathway signal [Polaromonas sp. 24-63-21]OZA49461.1 MAG: Twin-arginine translocation pathway signal [Polaromonas sp. 17-63-33]OZA87406.1 MAG: Twin-arginine translocation pathway